MTEKNYNPKQKERKALQKQEKIEQKKEVEKKIETQKEEPKKQEIKEEKKLEIKEKKKEVQKPKKTEAVVNIENLPISTKQAVAVCRFVKGKKITDAIANLEEVLRFKKPIPMKGEIAHRKGMMSGRYPINAVKHFIKLLKSLQANANVNELNEAIIVEAIANIGSRPYGRFGRTRKKRTNVYVKVKENKQKEQ